MKQIYQCISALLACESISTRTPLYIDFQSVRFNATFNIEVGHSLRECLVDRKRTHPGIKCD